jgi:hypothetical protein
VSKQHLRLPEQPISIALTECSSRAHPFLRFMAATDRARHPSGSSDRRTSVACRPAGSATPEERWCCNTSNEFAQYSWLPDVRHQSRAGSCCRRSALLQIGDGGTASHSIGWLFASQRSGLAGRRRNAYAKQRFTSNGFRSFSMWKHARASLWASALRAITEFVLAFLRS